MSTKVDPYLLKRTVDMSRDRSRAGRDRSLCGIARICLKSSSEVLQEKVKVGSTILASKDEFLLSDL